MAKVFPEWLAACLAALAQLGAAPALAAQRVFVASYGSDANTATECVQATPCRSFQAAISVVDSGGEVIALDAAGYGPATITRPMTLTANPGVYAGIATSTQPAVLVQSAGTVVIRGLDIRGAGALFGLQAFDSVLHVEHCSISNFDRAGIIVTGGRVRVAETTIRDSYRGIWLYGQAKADVEGAHLLGNYRGIDAQIYSAPSTISVNDSVISGGLLGIGFWTDESTTSIRFSVAGSTITSSTFGLSTGYYVGRFNRIGDIAGAIGGNQFMGNTYAVWVAGESRVDSMGDNLFSGNGVDLAGTLAIDLGT